MLSALVHMFPCSKLPQCVCVLTNARVFTFMWRIVCRAENTHTVCTVRKALVQTALATLSPLHHFPLTTHTRWDKTAAAVRVLTFSETAQTVYTIANAHCTLFGYCTTAQSFRNTYSVSSSSSSSEQITPPIAMIVGFRWDVHSICVGCCLAVRLLVVRGGNSLLGK